MTGLDYAVMYNLTNTHTLTDTQTIHTHTHAHTHCFLAAAHQWNSVVFLSFLYRANKIETQSPPAATAFRESNLGTFVARRAAVVAAGVDVAHALEALLSAAPATLSPSDPSAGTQDPLLASWTVQPSVSPPL